MALLEVSDLALSVFSSSSSLPVVRGISFEIDLGKTLGIVGESGCGKSLTSLAIMGLLEGTPIRVTAGTIRFKGRNLLELDALERRKIMGSEMAMIFQEPMTSLNPVYQIGDQIVESIQQHIKMNRNAARIRAIELLDKVRIPEPEKRLKSYPHQLSGGMRQRVMIAMALACDPQLLIADEPTTALDVTVQARILELLADLQKENDMAVVLISHDLGVISENCDDVAVMYRGKIIEAASSRKLFSSLSHPYTRGLLSSIPDSDSQVEELFAIPGRVPLLEENISGCAFHPRCALARDRCTQEDPEVNEIDSSHIVRCFYPMGGDV